MQNTTKHRILQNAEYYKTSNNTKRRILQNVEYYKTPNSTKRRILQKSNTTKVEYYKTSNNTKRRIIQNVNCFVNQMSKLVFISKTYKLLPPLLVPPTETI